MNETAQIVAAVLTGTGALVTALSVAYVRVRGARDRHLFLRRHLESTASPLTAAEASRPAKLLALDHAAKKA